LDRDLYLRIATELYLKRLVVGGITAGKSFHGFQVGLNPRLMRNLLIIDVHDR